MENRINPSALKMIPWATIIETVCVALTLAASFTTLVIGALAGAGEFIGELTAAGVAVSPLFGRSFSYLLGVYCIYGLLELSPRMERAWYSYIACIIVRLVFRIGQGLSGYFTEMGRTDLAGTAERVYTMFSVAGDLLYAAVFFIILTVFADSLRLFGEEGKAVRCRRLAWEYFALEVLAGNILFGYQAASAGGVNLSGAFLGGYLLTEGLILILRILIFVMLKRAAGMLYDALVYHAGEKEAVS